MKEEVKVLEFDGDVTASINLTAQETIMLTCLIGERINKSEANKENHDTWDCLHKKLKKFFKEEISTQFKEKKTDN